MPLGAPGPATVEGMEETPAGQEVLPATCRLCEAPLPAGGERCPSCGLYQATELPPPALWRLGVGLVAVYFVTAVILLLTR